MEVFLAAALKPLAFAAFAGIAWFIAWPIRRYLKRLPEDNRWRRLLLKRMTWYD